MTDSFKKLKQMVLIEKDTTGLAGIIPETDLDLLKEVFGELKLDLEEIFVGEDSKCLYETLNEMKDYVTKSVM
jgi:hypothetical protein